jgi:hypothetical protein
LAEQIIFNRRNRDDEFDVVAADDRLFGETVARLNQSGPDRPASLATAPREPAVAPQPDLSFRGEGKPQASFTDLVLEGANIGHRPGQVSFEQIKEAGGLEEVMRGERMGTPVVREVNEVLSALLGETTGTQRARPVVEELTSWQKGLLFVADITAAFQGRTPPSVQLREQLKRSITLQDQLNQESYLKGIDATNKFVEMINKLPIESRMRAATQQSARLRRDFGEGFGANLIMLAAEPSKAEAWEMFMRNAKDFEDGPADRLIKYTAYLTGAGDTEEAQKVFSTYGLGTKENPGVFEMEARYKAPSLLEAKLDGFVGELRRLGGEYAELASDIESGEKIIPSELVNANNALPENSEFKLDKSILRTLQAEPGRFAAVLPGMVSAEQQLEEQIALNNAERSTPMTFIGGKESDRPGHMVTAPATSKKAMWLMDNGYLEIGSQMDLLGGIGGGMSDSNMIRLGADFIKESANFSKIKAAYHTVVAASREPNAPGNVSMIFAFMKSLDPGSVVREGEQDTAARARARIDAIKTWMRRQVTGERLTETQVKQFVRIAQGIYSEVAHEQSLRVNRWVQRLDGLKIPRDRHSGVIVDLIGSDRALFGDEESELQPILDRFQ